MSYNPHIHHRRSIRLKGYDYSRAGLYFITICVQDMACLFGDIVGASLVDAQNMDAQMILNDAGKMVESEWLKLPERFKNIELHEYIVMPNHFHAILEIVGAILVVAQNNVVAQNETNENDKIEVRLEEETVWLTQDQMATLFGKGRSTIAEHIENVFDKGELEQNRTCRKFRQVRQEGNREVEREIDP